MGAGDQTVTLDRSGGLPVEQALLLEAACDAFESGWRSDGRPDIGAALVELPEAVRSAALRELVSLDVYYRREAGDHPAAADYAGRFTVLDPDWLARVVGEPARPGRRWRATSCTRRSPAAGRAPSTARPTPPSAARSRSRPSKTGSVPGPEPPGGSSTRRG